MHEAKQTTNKTKNPKKKRETAQKHPKFQIEQGKSLHLPKVETSNSTGGKEFETKLKEAPKVIKRRRRSLNWIISAARRFEEQRWRIMKGENWEGLKFGEEVENGKIGRGMQEEDDEDGRTELLSLSLSLSLSRRKVAKSPSRSSASGHEPLHFLSLMVSA